MAKTYRRKKRIVRRRIFGATLEKCVHCGRIDKINHTKCVYCNQSLCYSVAFGVVWQDCEYGILQRRDRETKEILTYYFPEHMCLGKKITEKLPSSFWRTMIHE